MITGEIYEKYLDCLLQGKRSCCREIVGELVQNRVDLKSIYTDLFQRSLYDVGSLWETNRISVAKEHLATAITEGLLNTIYPQLFEGSRDCGRAVISCSVNEYHQVGGKMVADIFEMNGWQGYFLGANTPVEELTGFIDEISPDLLGLSLSIYFNYPAFERCVAAVHSEFPQLDIIVGGQAFNWGGCEILKTLGYVEYIPSLDKLEERIKKA